MSAAPQLPETLHSLPPVTDSTTTRNREGVRGSGSGSSDHPVDHSRPIRVIVIGAGYSGIYLAIRLPERLRNLTLTVYEKNAGLGGTWYENRYPGCACDIPAHSYQYSFNPNSQWSSLYAPAREIQAYLEATARKYGADRFVRLRHQVEECIYDESSAEWTVKVRKLETGEVVSDVADVLITARGALNEPSWPEGIEGWGGFEGKVMHSAVWDESYDFNNKRVGVIGSGSSSIQIVPTLQKEEGIHVTTFVRNKTWISPPFGQDLWDEMGMEEMQFTEAQKSAFATNTTAYQAFRLRVEEAGNAIHAFTIKGTPLQTGGAQLFSQSMASRLASRPDIYAALLPSFAPGCRRLTPGPGYLEALCEPNVSFITSSIARITPRGIETADGGFHALDVLACATGFNTGVAPPFPVVGRKGTTLAAHWATHGYPRNYMSLATDGGFPNFFMMLGPNSAIGSGSLTMMIESVGDYVVKCVRKIQKERVRSMEVVSGAVDDFGEYARGYFKGTVFGEECRSWYKNERGEVTGLWPGSTQHCIEVLRSPRWEDFTYTYLPNPNSSSSATTTKPNRLAYLGNGWTDNQMRNRHLAWYLYPEFVDVPVEGKPEDKEEYDIRPFSH